MFPKQEIRLPNTSRSNTLKHLQTSLPRLQWIAFSLNSFVWERKATVFLTAGIAGPGCGALLGSRDGEDGCGEHKACKDSIEMHVVVRFRWVVRDMSSYWIQFGRTGYIFLYAHCIFLSRVEPFCKQKFRYLRNTDLMLRYEPMFTHSALVVHSHLSSV
jgi:hypothetical protein